MKTLSFPDLSHLEKTHASYIGVVYALLSHFIFVTSNFMIQKTGKRLNTFQILYVIGILLFTFNFFTTKLKKVPICSKDRKITKMLIVRATIGPLGACLGIMGFTMVSVSECTAIQMTTPAYTAVLATIFFGEKYDLMLFFNTLLCFFGVVFISKPTFLFGEGNINAEFPYRSFGVVITLLGAFVGSFVQISLRKLGSMVSPFVNTLHFALFLACLTGVAQIVFGINEISLSDVMTLGVVGVMHFGGHTLMNKSFSLGNAGTISLMMYSQVFFAYMIDVLYQGTKLEVYSVIGSICIFFCVFITLYRLHIKDKESTKVIEMKQESVSRQS